MFWYTYLCVSVSVCVCVCFSSLMTLLNQQTKYKLKRMKDGESGRKSTLKRWTRMTECQERILQKNLGKRGKKGGKMKGKK